MMSVSAVYSVHSTQYTSMPHFAFDFLTGGSQAPRTKGPARPCAHHCHRRGGLQEETWTYAYTTEYPISSPTQHAFLRSLGLLYPNNSIELLHASLKLVQEQKFESRNNAQSRLRRQRKAYLFAPAPLPRSCTPYQMLLCFHSRTPPTQ